MEKCNCNITWNKICKGKDIITTFPVMTNGEKQSLEDRDLLVEIIDPSGISFQPEFSVEGNVVKFSFYGIDHKRIGIHMVRLWENKGKRGQCMLDFTHAFELVATTEDEYFITNEEN